MMLIPCPHCGPRPETEFVYGGDANVRRPDPAASDAEWTDYIYIRNNPKGAHRELWLHSAGCHSWLTVERNTVTHELGDVSYTRDANAKGGGE